MIVRPVGIGDFDKLYAFAGQVPELRVSYRHDFMDPEEFKQSMLSPDSVFLVAEAGDANEATGFAYVDLRDPEQSGVENAREVLGFIYADSNDPEKRGAEKKWACLVYLAVAEQWRKRGVASALYEQCIAELQRRGVTHVYGWAGLSPAIREFLKARGFESGRVCVWMDRAL